ncbi:MAG: hypothetical protein M9894_35720 [Planctomycetes bacterium]|nr:hypothetical protein [Planctomycetota bacterium]
MTTTPRRRRRLGHLAAALLLAPLGGGCTVFTDYNDETRDPRRAFERGDFAGALAGYRQGLDATNDSLLYHLEGGAAAHVGGLYPDSMRLFEVAYRKIEEYQQRALAGDAAQVAASILVNEKTISYTGAVFEQVLLQAYQARNYFLSGKRDGVIVEVLRCYDIVAKAREIYEQELSATQGEAARNNEGVDVAGVTATMRQTYDYGDLSGAEDVYEINYVRYLNAFLREACATDSADFNAAWIDMKFVADRFGGEEFVRRDLARLARRSGAAEDAAAAERGLAPLPRDAGSVALFFECGMAPRKTEVKVYFPTYMGAAAIAMPKYEAVPNPAAAAMLVIGDQKVRTTTLSNVQSIAFRYQRDRLPLLIAKQVVRLAAKVAIQSGGAAVIRNNAGENAEAWAWLYGIGMSIWNIASEQADLRAWRTLPQTMQVARVHLPEGQYPAKLVLLGPGGNPLNEVDLGVVSIKAGRHRMVNARSIGANLFADVPAEPYDGQVGPRAAADTQVQDLRRPDATAPAEDVRRGPAPPRDEPRPEQRPEQRPSAQPPAGEARDLRQPDADRSARDPLDPGAGDPLDRLARLLQPGRPVCFQMVFEGGKGRDVAGNTTVDELRDESDERGRRLVVLTSNFVAEGAPHYFSFVVRPDGIEQVDLYLAPRGAWELAPKDTFWFKSIPGGEVRFDAPGRGFASRRGVCNVARGAKARGQVSVYLRTYHVDGAGALRY